MGFTLKKIISFFFMPVSIGLVLCLLALYYLFSQKIKKAKIFLSLTFFWFFFISFAPVSNMLVGPLEKVYAPLGNEKVKASYAILLGGDFQSRSNEILRLYRIMENLKVITSGFEGSTPISEAIEAKEKLIQLGVKQEDILTQESPKDTYEEALAVKKIVGSEPLILVTSAVHMPRAMLIFKNEGLNVISAPTHFVYKDKLPIYHMISAQNMHNSQKAIHEYLGLVYGLIYDVFKTFKGML